MFYLFICIFEIYISDLSNFPSGTVHRILEDEMSVENYDAVLANNFHFHSLQM